MKLVCAVLWRDTKTKQKTNKTKKQTKEKKTWTLRILWHLDLEYPCFEQNGMQIVSSPLSACLTKIDDIFTFGRIFLNFSLCVYESAINAYLLNEM